MLSLIGSGGMGEVYPAKDERNGSLFAIKVLVEEFLNDPKEVSRCPNRHIVARSGHVRTPDWTASS